MTAIFNYVAQKLFSAEPQMIQSNSKLEQLTHFSVPLGSTIANDTLTVEKIQSMNVNQLKYHLKSNNIKVSGNKTQLITRLTDFINGTLDQSQFKKSNSCRKPRKVIKKRTFRQMNDEPDSISYLDSFQSKQESNEITEATEQTCNQSYQTNSEVEEQEQEQDIDVADEPPAKRQKLQQQSQDGLHTNLAVVQPIPEQEQEEQQDEQQDEQRCETSEFFGDVDKTKSKEVGIDKVSLTLYDPVALMIDEIIDNVLNNIDWEHEENIYETQYDTVQEVTTNSYGTVTSACVDNVLHKL